MEASSMQGKLQLEPDGSVRVRELEPVLSSMSTALGGSEPERFTEIELVADAGQLLETAVEVMATAALDDEEEDVLYLVDFEHVRAKDATVQLAHPFYTLSKQVLSASEIHYEHNGDTITIEAGKHGLPTIYDKDIIIYVLSQVMRMRRERGTTPRRLRIRVLHLLEFTGRGSGGKSYGLLRQAMRRLTGVTIRTNIETGGERIDDDFHLLDSVRTVRAHNDPDGRMAYMEIELGRWLWNALRHDEVLTLSRDYLTLSRPLDRRIYEIARKHCGRQREWSIGLEALLKKTGSQGTKAKLKTRLAELERSGGLPDYDVTLDVLYEGKRPGSCTVRFTNRQSPSGTPLVQRALLPETVESVAAELGIANDEVYTMEAEFREHLSNTKASVMNLDAQFVLYATKRHRRRPVGASA